MDYDDIIEPYLAHIEKPGSWNNLYERPVMRSLLPPLPGKNVLDLGCASGYLAEYALAQGATVTAVDISRKWTDRLHDKVPSPDLAVQCADISRPMPFLEDASYDCIIASLVIHYLESWETLVKEMHRVLKPGGRVIISTHHPYYGYRAYPVEDFRKIVRVEETWGRRDGVPFKVSFYIRSLEETLRPFLESPFRIISISEPPPDEGIRDAYPEDYRRLLAEATFLFIVLEK